MKRALPFLVLSLVAQIHVAVAQIPQTMSYQGLLTDASGVVFNGNPSLDFKIYDQAQGGAPIWLETQQVAVANGLLNVILGSMTPLNLPFDKPYWLGISIDGGAELSPRTALTAVPYSLAAQAIVGHNTVVRSVNGLTDTLTIVGEGSIAVSTNGDTIVVSGGGVGGGSNTLDQAYDQGGAGAGRVIIADAGEVEVVATDGTALYAVSNSGRGVIGQSDGNIGVHGVSNSAEGVKGESTTGVGVFGLGQTERGVVGQSDSNYGVHGLSNTLYGVFAASTSGIGLVAEGGTDAAEFRGDVRIEQMGKLKIDEVPADPQSDKFLVWAGDKFVKYRTLPDGGESAWLVDDQANTVSTDKDVLIRDAEGNVTTEFNADGTSTHTGDETFLGEIKLPNILGGGLFLNSDGITTDIVEGFPIAGLLSDGSFFGRKILIADENSNTVTTIDGSGLTNQTLATFLAGIEGTQARMVHDPPDESPQALAGGEERIMADRTLARLGKAPVAAAQGLAALTGINRANNGAGVFGSVNDPDNFFAAVDGLALGPGPAVNATIFNPNSFSPAIDASTDGTGPVLQANHEGASGDIAVFKNNFANVARIDKTGKGFFNGGTEAGGADMAEEFAVEGTAVEYEPGDVIAISLENDLLVQRSAAAYSSLVIGVYATKPGVLLTERNIDDDPENVIPVGVVGVIPTKVSGENGPISRGDMLVAADLPGHAMRGTDRDRMFGATIGKALEDFGGEDTGVIRVLVNVR